MNRTFRVGVTSLWAVLMLFFLVAMLRHSSHPQRLLIFFLLGVVQIGSAWVFWEITADALVSHAFFFQGRTRLARIRYVGTPRRASRLLSKAVEVESADRPSMFVSVKEREAFIDALRVAIGQPLAPRPPVGPLGLSL